MKPKIFAGISSNHSFNCFEWQDFHSYKVNNHSKVMAIETVIPFDFRVTSPSPYSRIVVSSVCIAPRSVYIYTYSRAGGLESYLSLRGGHNSPSGSPASPSPPPPPPLVPSVSQNILTLGWMRERESERARKRKRVRVRVSGWGGWGGSSADSCSTEGRSAGGARRAPSIMASRSSFPYQTWLLYPAGRFQLRHIRDVNAIFVLLSLVVNLSASLSLSTRDVIPSRVDSTSSTRRDAPPLRHRVGMCNTFWKSSVKLADRRHHRGIIVKQEFYELKVPTLSGVLFMTAITSFTATRTVTIHVVLFRILPISTTGSFTTPPHRTTRCKQIVKYDFRISNLNLTQFLSHFGNTMSRSGS